MLPVRLRSRICQVISYSTDVNSDRPLFATLKEIGPRLDRRRYRSGRNDVGERGTCLDNTEDARGVMTGDVSYQKTIPIPTWAIRTWAFLRSILETDPRKSSRTSADWQQPAANGTYIYRYGTVDTSCKTLVIYAKIGGEIRSILIKPELYLPYPQFYGQTFVKSTVFKKVLFYIFKKILYFVLISSWEFLRWRYLISS